MVYTTDLKSVAEWLESSSLSARTKLDRWASGLCQQTVNLPPNGIASSNLALSTNFNGELGEWFNPAVLKTADPERGP